HQNNNSDLSSDLSSELNSELNSNPYQSRLLKASITTQIHAPSVSFTVKLKKGVP
ncbi:15086_t:CDS:1, partial [Racocetra fulgida]